MRRALGLVLIALGAFLIVLAPLARWYVAPRLATAPLNCSDESAICHDKVSRSPSVGEARALFNPTTLQAFPNLPVKLNSDRTVAGDVYGSRQSGHTIYNESLVTTAQVPNADGSGTTSLGLDAQTARVAFDGNTSELIDCCGANADGAAFPKQAVGSIMPYKFGFNTKAADVQYYDTVLNKALPMKYTGTEDVLGLKTYKFVQTIPPTKYDVLEVPLNLVGGADGSAYKADRTYANTRTVWVEPVTGAIVKGQEVLQQALLGPDGQPHLTLLDATLDFSAANVKASVQVAKDGKSKLQLLSTYLPIGALILGLLMVAGGILLIRRQAGPRGTAAGSAGAGRGERLTQPVPASAGLRQTKMAVPGSRAPRSGDQAPQTRS